MKQLCLLLFTLFTTINCWSQWTPVGDGMSLDELTTRQAVLRFQPSSNYPHVLFKEWEINDGEYIRMKRWNGISWDFVGNELIHECLLVSDHMDFEFHPLNNNIPLVYFASGESTNSVVGLNGLSWQPLSGLTNYLTDYQLGFGYDVSPTGEPTISFSDNSCPFGTTGTGNLTVVRHDGTEWEVLVAPCQTPNPATMSYLQYNPVTDKLLAYHKAGPDMTGSFEYAPTLIEFNVSSWDSIASPTWMGYFTQGRMKINPVTGNVFMYDRDFTDDTQTVDLFRVYRWDGTILELLPTDGVVVDHVNYELEFHPISGDPYLIYKDGAVFPSVFTVKRFDGSAWVDTEFGENLADEFMIELFDAQFDPITGNLMLAMSNGDQSLKVIQHDYTVTEVAEHIDDQVQIYPNPASDRIRISANGFNSAEVIDGMGKSVMLSSTPEFDISNLGPGVYFVRIAQKSTTTIKRFIKE